LCYGLAIIVIGTFVQYELNHWLDERTQGPPCRIDFSAEKFQWPNSTPFQLPFLFINLRDKDILIERFENYCYWAPKRESNKSESEEQAISSPVIKEPSVPPQLIKFPASQSEVKIAYGCLSPDKEGVYKIRIIARTTSGTCEGNILMEVKND